MAMVKNISQGPRGAYLDGKFVSANPGETIEADDYCEEWFEPVGEPEAPRRGRPPKA